MSYKEENEMLERIKEVEKTLNFQIANVTTPINDTINQMTTKLDLLTSKLENLDTYFNEYKIKVDKIDEFIQFKNKTLDQITSHELRINTILNDVSNMRLKYDKLFLDNLTVPGFIGEFCKFKTIRDYLDNNIKEMDSLNSFKNDTLLELKSYNRKIENLVKQFTGSLDSFGDRQNNILSEIKIQIHDMVEKEITKFNDKFDEVKIINSKEAKNLEEKSNELIEITKQTKDYKEKLKIYISDNIESINNDFDEIRLNITDFKEEYNNIKDNFQDIVKFVKNFNMKKYKKNKKDDSTLKRKIFRQKTVNFRSKQNDEFILMNKGIENNNDDLSNILEKKNTKSTEKEKKKFSSLKKVPKINKEKEMIIETEIEKQDKSEPIINIENKSESIINIENKNEPIKKKKEKIKKSEIEIIENENESEISKPNNKIEIEENIKPEIKKKTQQIIKNDIQIKLENKKIEIKKENISSYSKKLKIDVLNKLNTEKRFNSSDEEDNDYSPIILPKYLNKKINENQNKKEIINNNEKKIKTPFKHFSDITPENYSIKNKTDKAQNTINSKELIDEIEKKKYDKELSKKEFEELELKKHIINLRLRGKGDKTFGTTVMRDFNNNTYNNYMSQTNSYFYPHKKINIMFKTNENWNSNRKNKQIIDCDNSKGRKHNKIIPVSEILTNKTEIINRKIDEICELFKKNEY